MKLVPIIVVLACLLYFNTIAQEKKQSPSSGTNQKTTIKKKADSILISIYGKRFFKKNIIFSERASGVYDFRKYEHSCIGVMTTGWDTLTKVDNDLFLHYNFRTFNNERNATINLFLDKAGEMHTDTAQSWTIPSGLDNRSGKRANLISKNSALKTVYNSGGKNLDGPYLLWHKNEPLSSDPLAAGKLELFITEVLATDSSKISSDTLLTVNHHLNYHLNPWTGEIEAKIHKKDSSMYVNGYRLFTTRSVPE